MVSVPFYMAGQVGIIKDIAPDELPPMAWSDGANVLFRDGKITRRNGSEPLFGTLPQPALWNSFVYSNIGAFWIASSTTKLYATDGAVWVDVTRSVGGNYTVNDRQLWSGGMLSGIPVFTNGEDVPQFWAPINLSNDFANLTSWPATARCRIIKPFKNFLVALAVTKSGTLYPHLVKWSSPAAPGALPSSWDETVPSTQAGEVEITDEYPGEIRDGLSLRDMFVIYKDNSVWGMQFVGGNAIFRFFPILGMSGILGTHCVGLVKEGRAHIVATGDNDFVVFDGQNTESVLDDRWKKFFEDNLEPGASDRSFVMTIPKTKEAWLCFPTLGNAYPNAALIWNWGENTITFRALPGQTVYASIGALTSAADVWDLDTGTWDSDTTVWDTVQFRAGFLEPVAAAIDRNNLLGLERTQQNVGAIAYPLEYTAFVERTGLAITGKDRVTGAYKADPTVRKLVKRTWFKNASGTPFQVQIGGQETTDAPVIWKAPQTFIPGSMKYLDWGDDPLNTPLIAIRIFSDVAGQWTITGYDLEMELISNL